MDVKADNTHTNKEPSQLNLSSQSCFSNNSSSAADFNNYMEARLSEENNYYKNFNNNLDKDKQDKEPLLPSNKELVKDSIKDNIKEDINIENCNSNNNNNDNNSNIKEDTHTHTHTTTTTTTTTAPSTTPIATTSPTTPIKKISIFRKTLEFISKPSLSVMFGFSPIYFVESCLIVALVYSISKFILKETPAWLISIFVIYFFLYFDNRYQIINKLSKSQGTINNNIGNNSTTTIGNGDKQTSTTSTLDKSIISSPENYQKDVKSRINFYETVNNTSTSNLNNVNSTTTTTTTPSSSATSATTQQPPVQNQTQQTNIPNNNATNISSTIQTSSNTTTTSNNNNTSNSNNNNPITRDNSTNSLLNNLLLNNSSVGKTHTRSSSGSANINGGNGNSNFEPPPLPTGGSSHSIFYSTFPTQSFTDIDQSSTYRTRTFGSSSSVNNRKSLPPEYYNQYLNFLAHSNNSNNSNNNNNNNNNNQSTSLPVSQLPTPICQTPTGSDTNITNNNIDNENIGDNLSEAENSIDLGAGSEDHHDDQLSQNSSGGSSSNTAQGTTVNDETKQELSQLENSNKVKSTINKFSKLSTGVEEKLDWTLATCSLSPARSSHSVTVYGSSLVLIGGEGIVGQDNLIQFIDVERNLTISPKVTGGKVGPESIYGHDYCRIGNKFYLFGGFVSGKLSNKLYVLTIMDDSTVHWSLPRINSTIVPSARYGHTFTRYGNKFLLFAGCDSSDQCLNDLHILDPDTMSWQTPILNSPPSSPVGGLSTNNNNTVVPAAPPVPVSNVNNTTIPTTTVTPPSSTTNNLIIKGQPPSERYGHTSTILGEKLIIFGGRSNTAASTASNKNTQQQQQCNELNDTHILSLGDGCYQWQIATFHQLSEVPTERSFHSSTRVGRNIVMVGGKRNDTSLRDVWVLSYRMQWSKVAGVQFTPRYNLGLIKSGSKLFVLGGKGPGGSGNSSNNLMSNATANILDDIWYVNTVTLPITASVMMINYSDIKIDKEIGKGHFSKVLKGNWKGKEVAVKKLNTIKDKAREEMMQEFKAEVELLGSLQHPNLVTCYGYSLNPMCIVMEFLPTGNLFEIIHSKEQQKLDSALILAIAFDIARGMQHLHSRNIIHRDLKSSNLLMDKHFNIKIADLGIARETSFTQTMTTIGTVAWTAPEILRHESYNQKADVYSFAIVLWELLTGEEPYEGIPPMNAGILVASKGLRPELPENCDPNWKKLVVWCWSEDPIKRPSFEEVTSYLTKTF